MLKNFLKVVPFAVVVVALTGCFSSSEDKTDPPLTSPTVTAGDNGLGDPLTTGNPVVPADDGISAEEAKVRGVFAGDGDAAFEVEMNSANGEYVIVGQITNMGGVDETYTVVLLPDVQVSGEPMTIKVAPGEVESFEIVDTDQHSSGVRLDGEIIGEGVAQVDW